MSCNSWHHFLEFFMEWFLAIPWLYFEHHSLLIGVYWASTSMGFLPLLWPLLVIYFAHSLSNHVASYGILFKGFILTFLLATKHIEEILYFSFAWYIMWLCIGYLFLFIGCLPCGVYFWPIFTLWGDFLWLTLTLLLTANKASFELYYKPLHWVIWVTLY